MRKIKDDIYWTGYIDWNLRNFHGYSTPSGSTYNSYLILDEKPTLIDSVKNIGTEKMINYIKEIIDPSKICYIISNHTEMDHSGSIDKILEYCPNAQVVCSTKGEEHLKRHFKKNWNFKVVNNGDTLNIGKRNLSFFMTPMVHWPDNMVTYCAHDSILFSNDGFGQHIASSERFANNLGLDIVFYEAAKYYANIILPYGNQVLKVLDALSGLTIEMICPSHGLIWNDKNDISKLLELYKNWATHTTENKVLIIYDTMWHSTEKMAYKFFDLLEKANIPVELIYLQNTHISDIITKILFTKFLLIGSPILNNQILPTMSALLTYMKGLKTKNRFGLTFGSYGWSTVGFKDLEESLKIAGLELVENGIYLKFIPDPEELEKLNDLIPKIKNYLN